MMFLLAALAALPLHTGYVTDTREILAPAEHAALETMLREYEKRTTNEFAICIVDSLDGRDIKEYANALFHQWGIGKKDKDNGLLLLWSTGDRKVRIEVGYGLEGSLPDGRAGQIIREEILPKFRNNQWMAGLTSGTSAVMRFIDSQSAESTSSAGQVLDRTFPLLIVLPVFIGAFALIGVALVFYDKRRKKRLAREEEERREAAVNRMFAMKRVLTSKPDFTPPGQSPFRYVAPPHVREDSYAPAVIATTWDSSSGGSSGGSDSSGGGGDFGGGDSGGGGADGSY